MQRSRNWNAYNEDSWEVGSGVPIWAEPPARYIAGGTVVNKLNRGEKLAGGSPVDFNVKTKKAKILKVYRAKIAINGTTLTIYASWDLPVPHVGDAIMKVPDTIDGTGTAVTVQAIDNSVEGELKLTLSETIAGVVADDYLAEAAEAGANKGLYCKPWTFTLEDTIGAKYNTVGIARGQKYIFENVIPYLPAAIKANIKDVDWDWFNEVVPNGDYSTDYEEYMRGAK